MSKVRAIAIHLPQFHPIPENNEWWGTGFTEWTNVAKAKPLFKNHYQPHVPSDLGFYDLRLPEARQAQADLAKQYGIYGFCYYHYWFHGKRLLERPVDEIVSSGKPDFPFMLCWANGSWTRTWDGNDNILIEQKYSIEDDENHIDYLLKFFSDPHYIKVEGKPVFAICRTETMPFPDKTAQLWKQKTKEAGFPDLYLIRMEMFEAGYPAEKIGFDAAAEFQPDWRNFPSRKRSFLTKLRLILGINNDPFNYHSIFNYDEIVDKMLQKKKVDYKLFPGVTPGWDNTPRKKKGAIIFQNSTPGVYKRWLKTVINNFQPYSGEENFIFINAWNEWAEGNHLEPCHKWGREYLQATLDAQKP
ncbi:glycoside hydrolase family 99-like domain-containing protein [Pontibacter brevis]